MEYIVANEKNRFEFDRLFELYREEVSLYEAFDEIEEEIYFGNEKIIPFLIYDNGEGPVGFFVLARYPYAKPGCEYCVLDFYVLKEYRNKGIAKGSFEYILNNHKGVYCAIMYNSNELAVECFEKIVNTRYVVTERNNSDNIYYCVFEVK